MTAPGQPGFDPFEQGESVPSVSFKNAPLNSFVTLLIDEDSKWLQSRDFETRQPKFWDARPGEAPNPVMSAVVTGVVQDTPWARQSGQVGERRTIWAEKPSSMFEAIQTAKRAAKQGDEKAAPIGPGGTLHVAFTGEEPNKKNSNLNNTKVYQARYDRPAPGYGRPDAFEGNAMGGAPAQQAPQQQYQQPMQQAPQPTYQQPVQQQPQYQQAAPQGFPPAQQQVPAQAQPQQPQGFPPAQQQVPAQAQPQSQFPPAQPQGFPPAQQAAPAPQQSPFPQAQQQSPTDPWAAAPTPAGDVPPF